MTQALVSIIIPCHNAERYVGESIESALAQTYVHKEVVVVDDGSTDSSLEVIRSFGKQIRCVTGPQKGGGAARNRGLGESRGEYIQFLDADDLLDPRKLELQTEVLRVAGTDLVISFGKMVDFQSGRILRECCRPVSETDDFLVHVLHGNVTTVSPLHRRGLLTQVQGFREDLNGSQEFDLHLRLAAKGARARCVPEILYTQRVRDGSVSSNYVKTVGQQLICVPPVYQYLRASGQLSETRAQAFAELMARSARGCLQRGGVTEGLRFLEEARRMHPDGGLRGAYSSPARLLYHVAGPVFTERLVAWKRRLI